MSDLSKFEKACATSEARDALASRPAGSSTAAIAAALPECRAVSRAQCGRRLKTDPGAAAEN